MQIPDILISPVEQGMLCPRQDGAMDLYLIRSLNKLILTCSECELTCDAPVDHQHDPLKPLTAADLFPGVLDARTQFSGYAQRLGLSETELSGDMQRILDHRIFAVDREAFAELMLEAWQQREFHQLPKRHRSQIRRESIVDVNRPIGPKGETAIYLRYTDEPEEIHEAFPVFREGGS